MQSEHPEATKQRSPTEPEMEQGIQKIRAAMVNKALAGAMKHLDDYPGELDGAIANPRGYLEDHGVKIPTEFEVTIRKGNSWTLCYVVNGVAICFTVG